MSEFPLPHEYVCILTSHSQAIQSLRQQSENIKNIMAEVNKAKESESRKQSIQELMKYGRSYNIRILRHTNALQ